MGPVWEEIIRGGVLLILSTTIAHLMWNYRRGIERRDKATDAEEGRRRRMLEDAAGQMLKTTNQLIGQLSTKSPTESTYRYVTGHTATFYACVETLEPHITPARRAELKAAVRALCDREQAEEQGYTCEYALAAATRLRDLVASWIA